MPRRLPLDLLFICPYGMSYSFHSNGCIRVRVWSMYLACVTYLPTSPPRARDGCINTSIPHGRPPHLPQLRHACTPQRQEASHKGRPRFGRGQETASASQYDLIESVMGGLHTYGLPPGPQLLHNSRRVGGAWSYLIRPLTSLSTCIRMHRPSARLLRSLRTTMRVARHTYIDSDIRMHRRPWPAAYRCGRPRNRWMGKGRQ